MMVEIDSSAAISITIEIIVATITTTGATGSTATDATITTAKDSFSSEGAGTLGSIDSFVPTLDCSPAWTAVLALEPNVETEVVCYGTAVIVERDVKVANKDEGR